MADEFKPVFQTRCRSGPREQQMAKKVKWMFEISVFESSSSEWFSPIVFAMIQDGSLCSCADYEEFNTMIGKALYSIPRMDKSLYSLRISRWFRRSPEALDPDGEKSTVDKTYWRNMAITSRHVPYQYRSMPFGLRNVPSTFQGAFEIVHSSVKWNYALAYLEDIIISSQTTNEYLTHLKTV